MTAYLVPAGFGEAELIEKRSRFIGQVWRTDTEAEALNRLRETRERHRGAAHNVYAYIIRENHITRYSDDGEPGGSSGQPTLNVFAAGEITNVCCIVTRYFGGTLLGLGGLTRAYARAAKLALDAAGIARMAQWRQLTVSCAYALYERTGRLLEIYEAQVSDTRFGTDVVIDILLREDRADSFIEKLADLSNGRALCESAGSRFLGARID
ncbi:MAG: YigZ family protein [Oscillospiraceae bacterium]|jgi:uncharacterized YigZ family protein|nr:YigZ family protein [Oscillospiraceae bacterium]